MLEHSGDVFSSISRLQDSAVNRDSNSTKNNKDESNDIKEYGYDRGSLGSIVNDLSVQSSGEQKHDDKVTREGYESGSLGGVINL